jgi:HK97 family phage major capsid protein
MLTSMALLEIADLQFRAKQAIEAGNFDQGKRLLKAAARIENPSHGGFSSDEMRERYTTALNESLADKGLSDLRYRAALRNYMCGKPEMRDLLTGTQAISYTQGLAGGYFVDTQMRTEIVAGLKQVSRLFDPDVVTLIQEPTFAMHPKKVSGWDLTSIASVQVSEAGFQAPNATPTVSGKLLGGYTHRVSLAQDVESEMDVQGSAELTSRAAAVGFAQGMGNYLVNGSGASQPSGILTGSTSSGIILANGGYRQSQGYVDQREIEAVYFSVNRLHRASPKCAWLMSDTSWNQIRSTLYDSNSRPLLDIENGQELLMGKPVYIEPNLTSASGGSPIVDGEIIFGDLSHFYVRLSNISVQRTLQSANSLKDITTGEFLWVFRTRVDSTVYDPSGGNAVPIVSASVYPNGSLVA